MRREHVFAVTSAKQERSRVSSPSAAGVRQRDGQEGVRREGCEPQAGTFRGEHPRSTTLFQTVWQTSEVEKDRVKRAPSVWFKPSLCTCPIAESEQYGCQWHPLQRILVGLKAS